MIEKSKIILQDCSDLYRSIGNEWNSLYKVEDKFVRNLEKMMKSDKNISLKTIWNSNKDYNEGK